LPKERKKQIKIKQQNRPAGRRSQRSFSFPESHAAASSFPAPFYLLGPALPFFWLASAFPACAAALHRHAPA
jgi:hypothetical protein